jgi:hypothetical protein
MVFQLETCPPPCRRAFQLTRAFYQLPRLVEYRSCYFSNTKLSRSAFGSKCMSFSLRPKSSIARRRIDPTMSKVKIAKVNLPNPLSSSDSAHGPIGICNSPVLGGKKRRVANLCPYLVLICCYVLEPSSCHLQLQCFAVRDQE